MIRLSPDMTVSAIAADLPGAAELSCRNGINFCCGGSAALKASLLPVVLTADLQALADAAGCEAPDATAALIDHILSRYHETHRVELEWLIPLAQTVERMHGDHDAAPLGLTEALIALHDDLDAHITKEEAALFSLMRRGGNPMIAHPIAQMRHEHDHTAKLLAGLDHVTHGLRLPEGACGSWTALYLGLRKFSGDPVAHMHLENNVLFARFEPKQA